MLLDFVKMNGLGNDFVMIENMDRTVDLSTEQVKAICDRHFGVGADGVILIQPSGKPNCVAYMHYINSDGTLAQMCGNGVRCFAKFLVDESYVDGHATELTADTMAGPRHISFTRDSDNRMKEATVRMGKPILEPDLIPVNANPNAKTSQGKEYLADFQIESPWGPFGFTCVSMGNPHAVCFIDDWKCIPDSAFIDGSNKSLETFDVNKVGKYFESHEIFPEKANIEFAEIRNDGIYMRVYERGCAETMACGTGACAVNTAAVLTKGAPLQNDLHLVGGTLRIELGEDGVVSMTGPAEASYIGKLDTSIYDK